jgi:hypothetical protein
MLVELLDFVQVLEQQQVQVQIEVAINHSK